MDVFLKKWLIIFAILVSPISSFCNNKEDKTPEEKGLEVIKTEAIKECVEFLSDDKMEGRISGSAGALQAADYIATYLKDIGIKPFGESYFQDFDSEKMTELFFEKLDYSILTFLKSSPSIRNVLGVIEGNSKDEYIIVGAHYDHIGISTNLSDDRIFNGADDNASGVSAVLQIAKAFLNTGDIPSKTIIFAFWDAEEAGLIGSQCFIRSFGEINNIKSYLNLDMIGRDNKGTGSQVAFIYSDTTSNYDEIVKEEIVKHKLNLELITDINTINSDFSDGSYNDNLYMIFRGNSDQMSFEEKNIPIFLYTTGLHPDYHKVSDHAENINWEKLTNISKLSFLTLYRLVNSPTF